MICMKSILPPTSRRVSIYTDHEVNEMIRNNTLDNLSSYEDADIEEISRRIQQLNSEWDTERFVETKAALTIMGTSLLGISKNKFWSFLTLIAGTFLLQHALLGWCPSSPVMRKMGIRTSEEIQQEKMVLKALRKDLGHIKSDDAEDLLKMMEKQ